MNTAPMARMKYTLTCDIKVLIVCGRHKRSFPSRGWRPGTIVKTIRQTISPHNAHISKIWSFANSFKCSFVKKFLKALTIFCPKFGLAAATMLAGCPLWEAVSSLETSSIFSTLSSLFSISSLLKAYTRLYRFL